MRLKNFHVSLGMFAFAVLLLLVGSVLIGTAWFLRPITEAEQADREGHPERALELYGVGEKRFDAIPLSKRLLPRLYDFVVTNELSVMYSLQQYDAIIDKAGTTGVPGGRLWAGCALFGKGALESKPDARMGFLSQSQEEFRRALEVSSSDWDVKFNYELTAKVIAELRKPPQSQKQQMIKPLKPPPKPTRKVS